MDFWSGPLQDAFNPPARYALESDSEDEIGEGLYDGNRHMKPKQSPKVYNVSFSNVSLTPGSEVIVAVGIPGLRLLNGMKDDSKVPSNVLIDDVDMGYVCELSKKLYLIAISSTLPNTALHPLSISILEIFKPARLAILDTYPLPSYISSLSKPTPSIRYLRTTPSAPNDVLPPHVKPFSPPNLLGTQTLSSALLCEAQIRQMSGSLKLSTTLLLLPMTRIPPPPPRTLNSFSDSLPADTTVVPWSEETVAAIASAFGLDAAILAGSLALGSSSAYGKTTRGTGDIGDGGMYI